MGTPSLPRRTFTLLDEKESGTEPDPNENLFVGVQIVHEDVYTCVSVCVRMSDDDARSSTNRHTRVLLFKTEGKRFS